MIGSTNLFILIFKSTTIFKANSELVMVKKMKVLCLHSFRTSGGFLKQQISEWDPSIFADFDLDFLDGLFLAGGKSDIEGIFPPPYFEWFQFKKEFTEYANLEECISYLCEYMTSKGPFDGLLGFSQGAILGALLAGYQLQGKVLKDHPPIKFLISISGAKFMIPDVRDVAFRDPILVKSVHLIGEKDWLKTSSEELVPAFVDPVIIRHPNGHTVPLLDDAATELLVNFTKGLLTQKSAAKDGVQNGEVKVEEKAALEPTKVEEGST